MTGVFVLTGTSSTNTVGAAVSSQAPPSQPPAMAPSRKGTFTDDLHKLVDNWARDAMNLSGKKVGKGHSSYEVRSSGCPSSTALEGAAALEHCAWLFTCRMCCLLGNGGGKPKGGLWHVLVNTTGIVDWRFFRHTRVTCLGGWITLQGPGMARKFSAPGQLCISMTSSLGATPIPAASATSLGPFSKAMCPPQQYGYPAASFPPPWSGPGGPAQPQLGQFQPVGATSLQSFNISNLQKSVSNPPGSNLRTT